MGATNEEPKMTRIEQMAQMAGVDVETVENVVRIAGSMAVATGKSPADLTEADMMRCLDLALAQVRSRRDQICDAVYANLTR